VLRARVPALVVPFAAGREDEQTRRAVRLARLDAVRVLEAARADGATLAAEIRALVGYQPAPLHLDMDGARVSARIVADALRRAGRPADAGPERRLMAVSA
jgi:predicted glycosyltransferase